MTDCGLCSNIGRGIVVGSGLAVGWEETEDLVLDFFCPFVTRISECACWFYLVQEMRRIEG